MRKPLYSAGNGFVSHANYNYPSFLEGMARILDICDTLNQDDLTETTKLYSQLRARRLAMTTGPAADAEAIRKVWLIVGQHLGDSIGEFEKVEQLNQESSEKKK